MSEVSRQPEARLVAKIKARIEERGGRPVKIHGSDEGFQEVGISDLLVCYLGRFIAMEVKLPTGRLRPRQVLFLKSIEAAGGIVAVVTSVAEADVVLDSVVTAEEAKWIAGFFDGEGSISIRPKTGRQNTRVALHMGQKDPAPLLWVQKILGMGNFYDQSHRVNYRGTPRGCRLDINKQADVVRFLRLVGPHIRLRHRRLKVEEACTVLGIDSPSSLSYQQVYS